MACSPTADASEGGHHGEALPHARDGDDRLWGALSHLAGLSGYVIPIPFAGLLGPLVIWLAKRDESAFVEHQGRQALNFQIAMGLLYLASLPLWLVVVGIFLTWAVAIIDLVFVIIATVQASSGRPYRYPFNMNLVGPDTFRRRLG